MEYSFSGAEFCCMASIFDISDQTWMIIADLEVPGENQVFSGDEVLSSKRGKKWTL